MNLLNKLIIIASVVFFSGCHYLPTKNSFSQVATEKWSIQAAKVKRNDQPLKPLLYEDQIIQASANGVVKIIDIATGSIQSSFHHKEPLSTAPGITAQQLVLVTTEGKVTALKNKAKLWETKLDSAVLATPAVGSGWVVLQTVDEKLIGLNNLDGKKMWVVNQEPPVLSLQGSSSPLLMGDFVLAGFSNGKVAVYDLETGRIIWERRIASPKGESELSQLIDVDSDLVLYQGVVYAAAYQGNLTAIELLSGRVIWSHPFSTHQDLYVANQLVVAIENHGEIYAFDPKNGHTLWKQELFKDKKVTAPVAWKEYIVVGDDSGHLHFLAKESGQVQHSLKASRHPVYALMAKDLLFSLDQDGELTAFQ